MWTARRSGLACFAKRRLASNSGLLRVVKTHNSVEALKHRDPPNADLLIEDQDVLAPEPHHVNKVGRIARILLCDEERLQSILKEYPEITEKPASRLEWTARILRSNYPVDRILRFPSVLNLSWRLVENRREVLNEIGFQNIDPVPALVLFDELCEMSLFELNRRKFISAPNLLARMVSCIENPSPGLESHLNSKLKGPGALTLTLAAYRFALVQEYLSFSIGDLNITDSKLKMIAKQSIGLLSSRVNILLNDLQLDKAFLKSQPNLFLVNTHNLRDIVDRCKTLNNVALRNLVMRNPKILAMSAERLCELEDILHARRVKPELLEHFPEIYNINPQYLATPANKDYGSLAENDTDISMRGMHFQDILQRIALYKVRRRTRSRRDSELEIDLVWSNKMDQVVGSITRHFVSTNSVAETTKFLLDENILNRDQIICEPSICLRSKDAIAKGWDLMPKDLYERELGPDWRNNIFLGEMLIYEMENNGLTTFHKIRQGSTSDDESEAGSADQTSDSAPGQEEYSDDKLASDVEIESDEKESDT
ncbi:uncharacterized protein LOC100906997 [Galendromus occidentalis]|uniref:Uncharacterized protein LOC100906997 n=1 Tax=Galendromus occidentalis TaxID=34638 RepID=A0AAJ7L6N6_9ACAR|nr:uncharacterized protein LOC100906997 [Galendromus occidentalis]